jgi:hypothetical protein
MSTPLQVIPKEPKVIECRIQCEVTDIVPVEEKYVCTGYVGFRQKTTQADAPKLAKDAWLEESPFSADECIFTNGLDIEVKDEWLSASASNGVLTGSIGFKGQMQALMDLRRFPFDRQMLTMRLALQTTEAELRFEEYEKDPSWFTMLGTLPNQWHGDLVPPRLVVTRAFEMPHPELRMFIQRNPLYYLTNVILPLFLIISMALSSFALPPDKLDVRLAIILTLLLTAVAFKYVVAGYLPKVSYVTLLDGYVITAYLALVLIGAENCFAFQYSDMAVTRTHDLNFAIWFAASWGFIHVIILIATLFPNLIYQSWDSVVKVQQQAAKERDDAYYYTPGIRAPLFEVTTD